MPALLVVCFLVVPLAEIWVIVQVGQAIGGWQTFALLLLESLLGGWIVKREGVRAWRALRASLAGGGLPSRELLDAALVLVGGTLLLAPGFLTDVVGFFLVLPPTRPVARRLVTAVLVRRLLRRGGAGGLLGTLLLSRGAPARPPRGAQPGWGSAPGGRPSAPGDVVPGEVLHRDDEG
ncbi:UPF0716 protein FxsA [Motilibacter peucedani]|uniref:UPF0716 protein FxsA n=1 Tax=Motilibacter peucedani TaxID=598650 RepID=A0A420XK57_9ACTN|nr:FxsA family protein [Motilibacter peucedani]RKS67898.1 UPF0716 protein FxsA [Motilibacter peucedani]